MRRFFAYCIFSFALFAFFHNSEHAGYATQLCNVGREQVWAVVAQSHGKNIFSGRERIYVSGWYDLKPGDCTQTFNSMNGDTSIYQYVALFKHNHEGLWSSIQNPERQIVKIGILGQNLFEKNDTYFCVKDTKQPFEIEYSEPGDCPRDSKYVLFPMVMLPVPAYDHSRGRVLFGGNVKFNFRTGYGYDNEYARFR